MAALFASASPRRWGRLHGVRWRHCTVPERSSMDHDARRDRMIRMALFIVVGLGLAGSPAAWAQNAVPGSDDNRYTFNRVEDGYLRLDGRTGQVSVFAPRPAGLGCGAGPDGRGGLQAAVG